MDIAIAPTALSALLEHGLMDALASINVPPDSVTGILSR